MSITLDTTQRPTPLLMPPIRPTADRAATSATSPTPVGPADPAHSGQAPAAAAAVWLRLDDEETNDALVALLARAFPVLSDSHDDPADDPADEPGASGPLAARRRYLTLGVGPARTSPRPV